jgi:endonuclease III
MNLLHNFPSARNIATANKKQLIDTIKINKQLYFDENKLDQIITLSKNLIGSGNDAHELALQKRIKCWWLSLVSILVQRNQVK